MTWPVIAAVAIFFGVVHLEDARRDQFLRPMTLLQAGVAGWLLWRERDWMFESGGIDRLTCLALAFSASAPFLGYFWWGRNGKIRRFAIKGILVTSIAGLVAFLALPLGTWTSLRLAGVALLLALTPWQRFGRLADGWRRRRRQEADQRALRLETEERERQDEAAKAEEDAVLTQFIEHLRR